MKCHIFITGTDTGVGKTYVTAALLAEMRRRGIHAGAYKPIACGEGGRRDAKIFARIMEGEQSLDQINPIYLQRPLAPSVAAKLEGKSINVRRIRDAFERLAAEYPVLLVEGAGGLLVPIQRNYYVVDLVDELELPLVVIARLGLGTINHSLLTVRAAQAAGLKVLGVVLNDTVGGKRDIAAKTNIRTVPQLCRVPLLGVVPHGKNGMQTAAGQICDQLFS